jgi:hypothetical protein
MVSRCFCAIMDTIISKAIDDGSSSSGVDSARCVHHHSSTSKEDLSPYVVQRAVACPSNVWFRSKDHTI